MARRAGLAHVHLFMAVTQENLGRAVREETLLGNPGQVATLVTLISGTARGAETRTPGATLGTLLTGDC